MNFNHFGTLYTSQILYVFMIGNILAIWPTHLTPSVSSVRDKHHMSSYTKDQIH